METMTESGEKPVLLPQSAQELEDFISGIVQEFGLPEGDDTSEMIATSILHLQPYGLPSKREAISANYIRKGARQ